MHSRCVYGLAPAATGNFSFECARLAFGFTSPCHCLAVMPFACPAVIPFMCFAVLPFADSAVIQFACVAVVALAAAHLDALLGEAGPQVVERTGLLALVDRPAIVVPYLA